MRGSVRGSGFLHPSSLNPNWNEPKLHWGGHWAGFVLGQQGKGNQSGLEKFFDNKVKKSSTEEEIKEFVLRAYGLLLTRGIYGNTYMCATRICESILPSIFQRQGWQIEKALLSRQENNIQIDANTRPVKAAQPARLEWEADHKSGW